MRTWLLIGLLLASATDARSLTLRRDVEVTLAAGILNADRLIGVRDGARIAGDLTFQIHAVRHLGYFLNMTLAPARRRALLSNQAAYQDALLGMFGAGVFYGVETGPVALSYRLGYGAIGDGVYFSDLFLHGISLSRKIKGRLKGHFNLRQILIDTQHVKSLGLSSGLSWTF